MLVTIAKSPFHSLAIRYRPIPADGIMASENPVPPYQEQFPVGSRVRVRARLFLEQFQREWKYHHPIPGDQINAARRTDTVKSVGFYHGGDVLYQLSEIPGTWHEVCLESAL